MDRMHAHVDLPHACMCIIRAWRASEPVPLDLADRLKADEECVICQEELKLFPNACVGFTCNGARACTHVVHSRCAHTLLAQSRVCPVCRSPIDCTVSIDLPTLFAKEPVLLLSDVDALREAVAGISSCVEGKDLPSTNYPICALLCLSNVCCR